MRRAFLTAALLILLSRPAVAAETMSEIVIRPTFLDGGAVLLKDIEGFCQQESDHDACVGEQLRAAIMIRDVAMQLERLHALGGDFNGPQGARSLIVLGMCVDLMKQGGARLDRLKAMQCYFNSPADAALRK